MNLKSLGLQVVLKKNMNLNDYAHCYVTGCHCDSLLRLNKKVSCEGLSFFGGGLFCNIYIAMFMQSLTVKFHI